MDKRRVIPAGEAQIILADDAESSLRAMQRGLLSTRVPGTHLTPSL
jgi:hypothetical protein